MQLQVIFFGLSPLQRFDSISLSSIAKDGRGPSTLLTDAVLNKLGLHKVEQLIPWAYDEKDRSWSKFAELAPLASQCASQGDQVANSILEYAADQILVSINVVAKELGLDKANEFPLVLAGGNFTNESSLLSSILTKKVMAKYQNCRVTLPVVDIAVAGALMVIKPM